MKKSVSVCAVLFALTVLLAGCSIFKSNDSVRTNAVMPQGPSSGVAASGSSAVSPETSSESSKEAPSSGRQNAVIPESGSQPGPVAKIETENAEFNKKFKENPIDKKYIKEMNKAASNIDMVKVSDKYSKIWQKEIDNAYSGLKKYMKTDSSKKPEQYEAEQKKWENEKENSLNKISSEVMAEGGSLAQVDEASAVMDFYRARAAAVYAELYTYNKNYTYNFGS